MKPIRLLRDGTFDAWVAEHQTEIQTLTGELCLAVDGAPASVGALYESWKAKDIRVVAEPTDEGFGRSFVVADSDGSLIQVAPVD